jgi:hypothetical protein
VRLNHVIAALRNGAVLHLSLADRPTWRLSTGTTEVTVNRRSVQTLIKRGLIAESGDSLFAGVVPSQIWRLKQQE